MNLNTTTVTINRCRVCAYPFADKHHIWPQAKGGRALPTMLLCPNHHRYANMVQAMVMQNTPDERIKAFARTYFDKAFNTAVLDPLIKHQEQLWNEGWLAYAEMMKQRAIADPNEMLRIARLFVDSETARLDHIESDEEIPATFMYESLAHLDAILAIIDASP